MMLNLLFTVTSNRSLRYVFWKPGFLSYFLSRELPAHNSQILTRCTHVNNTRSLSDKPCWFCRLLRLLLRTPFSKSSANREGSWASCSLPTHPAHGKVGSGKTRSAYKPFMSALCLACQPSKAAQLRVASSENGWESFSLRREWWKST